MNNEPLTISVPGDPYPMTKPKANLVWRPGQETRPFVEWTWPEGFRIWRETARKAAKKAMRHRTHLFGGYVSIGFVFAFTRPQSHYGADGIVKEGYIETVPAQWPMAHELLRGALDAIVGVALKDLTEFIAIDHLRKEWAPAGFTEITLREVRARDVVPELATLPEQLDMFDLFRTEE